MIRSSDWRWSVLVLALPFVFATALSAATEELPVLLVHGFQPIPGVRITQLWEECAEYLSGNDMVHVQTLELADDHEFFYLPAVDAQRRDVFVSNYALPYEPTTRDIFFYTRRFADEIGFMQSEFGVQELDVVGHSMVGLIARTYAEISDFEYVIGGDDFGDYGIDYGGEIATLVMLATPNHGTLIASLAEWFSTLSRQLEPGSEFLWLLNEVQWVDGCLDALNPAIRYVSMASQTCLGCGLRLDEEACLAECVEEGLAWNGSDLVVMMTSAYLPGAENYALIGFDHVRSHSDAIISAAIETVLDGERLPVAIYAPELQDYHSD